MTDSLNNAANKLFNNFELDDKKIQALMALEQVSVKQHSYLAMLSKVAGLFAVAIFITLFAVNQNNRYKQDNIVNLIVAEVVKNHRNLKPLEVSSDQLVSVSKYFDQLSFSPYQSNNQNVFSALSKTLIGGRYCSIQGSTAAQLRMKSREGSLSTLFQAGMSDLFINIPDFEKGEASIVQYKDGYEVQLWQEKGLLMVWVKPASS
jgi:hypothetical protein